MPSEYLIDWEQLKPKCPKCGSTSIKGLGRFKQEWTLKPNGTYNCKELEEHKCKACKNIYWK